MFWKRKKPKKSEEDLAKDKLLKESAAMRNKEAALRLEKALERLGPLKGASDLLGGKS